MEGDLNCYFDEPGIEETIPDDEEWPVDEADWRGQAFLDALFGTDEEFCEFFDLAQD